MVRAILILLAISILFGCAIHKDKDGVTHIEYVPTEEVER